MESMRFQRSGIIIIDPLMILGVKVVGLGLEVITVSMVMWHFVYLLVPGTKAHAASLP